MGNFLFQKPDIRYSDYEKNADGIMCQRFDLSNGKGLEVAFISYGATMISAKFPDKDGLKEELTLQYPSLALIEAKSPYYGSTVGRVANRICQGKFTLDGIEYTLAINNPPNHLHGGVKGWSKQVWAAETFKTDDTAGVIFRYTSPDGDEGYPGTVKAEVTYFVNTSDELHATYKATTDKTTPVNLTNHAYWNMSGFNRKAHSHLLDVNAEQYLELDNTSIPTGARINVEGTEFDFRQAVRLEERIPAINGGPKGGIDHCFVIKKEQGECGYIGSLFDEESKRKLTVFGTQPGLQVYTSNYLSENDADSPHTLHNAVCLETQHFPDAVNHCDFESVFLSPNTEYFHKAIFKFSIAK